MSQFYNPEVEKKKPRKIFYFCNSHRHGVADCSNRVHTLCTYKRRCDCKVLLIGG